jgi:hypothetical protein
MGMMWKMWRFPRRLEKILEWKGTTGGSRAGKYSHVIHGQSDVKGGHWQPAPTDDALCSIWHHSFFNF